MKRREIIEICTKCRYSCKTTDINKAYGCKRFKATREVLRKRSKRQYGRQFVLKESFYHEMQRRHDEREDN